MREGLFFSTCLGKEDIDADINDTGRMNRKFAAI